MRLYIHGSPYHHTATIGIYFRAGTRVENTDNYGISHLTEHMQFRRLSTIPNKELYSMINRLGSSLHGVTTPDVVSFYMTVESPDVIPALTIIIKELAEPLWVQEELEKEKQVVLRQLVESDTDYFQSKCREKYFRNTPYVSPIIGTYETIDRLSLSDVISFKNTYFTADNAALVITGGLREDDKAKIYEMLGSNGIDIASMKEMPSDPVPRGFCDRTEDADFFIGEHSENGRIHLVMDVPDTINGDMAMMIKNLYGTGDGSRIVNSLKEDLGWTGDVDCYYERFPSFGRIVTELMVDQRHLLESLEVMLNESSGMRERITKNDFQEVIRFQTNLGLLKDDSQSLNWYLGQGAFILGYEEDLAKLQMQLQAITPDDLRETASSLFQGRHISVYVSYDNRFTKKKDLVECMRRFRSL